MPMTRFVYTAQKEESGEVYKGVAEAKDKYEVFAQIRHEGAKAISVDVDSSSSKWSISYWNARITTVPEQEKVVFAQTLSSMLTAGLNISRALSVIERQTKNPRFSRILATLESDVRRGDQLNQAIAKFPSVFSPLFISMIRAGEESGDVPGALKIVGDQMERSYTLKKKIRGAMIYPAIIIIAIIGISILMMTQVVPTLASTFEELHASLPKSTRVMIGMSDFLVHHTILAVLVAVLAVSAVYAALKVEKGKRARDFMLLHIPIISGLVKEINAARTARTLSSLMAAGVDMVTTISITEDVVQNTYFKQVLEHARTGVQQGEPLSKSFVMNEKLYPPLVGEMIAVGEETGDLTHMLQNLAVFYEDEVSRKTKDMSTVIEPFLMLIIGSAVGFFAVSMITPIYSLSSAI